MKRFAKPILLGFLISLNLCMNRALGNAQTDSTMRLESKLALNFTIQPLFVISNALKFDLEIQQSRRRFAYILSPEFYGGQISDTSIPVSQRNNKFPDRIKGFGLGIQQKVKFKKQSISPYLAYGATYRRLNIEYKTDGFIPFEENGLSYYGYGPVQNPVKINNLLLNCVLGIQTFDLDFLLIDVYAGFGYKIADISMSNPGERRYNKTFYSPAFDGPIMMTGIKLGTQIKK